MLRYTRLVTWPPTTMATQHPDNAGKPWWGHKPFINTHEEIEELLTLFKELPIDEYMWDWEGKYVDESVGEKLYSRAHDFFMSNPLGKDLHLTYRIPAFDGEKMHRMARAMMNVLALADFARDIGIGDPPVTEMFLPLTTSADQPMKVRSTFKDVAGYHRAVFHRDGGGEDLSGVFEVTPLVEDVESLFTIDRILRPYWESLRRERGKALAKRGQRIFMARSDPAMNAGIVPAVLAIKAALSTVHDLGEELGFPVHPVIGTGSLPFRGSVNPTYTDTFLPQYAGVRTYSIQSAFRYDYPKEQVAAALAEMKKRVPSLQPVPVTQEDAKALRGLSDVFSAHWKSTIEALAPFINDVVQYVPPRRERVQHIGLFGYSRGVGTVKLPRAIGFTAAFYTLGVPPEFITTGRGLKEAKKRGLLPLLQTFYPALTEDLRHAGKYFNEENLKLLSEASPAWAPILEDVAGIREVLGIELGPEKPHHMIHRNLTSTIHHRLRETERDADALTRDTVEAGVVRRSLG